MIAAAAVRASFSARARAFAVCMSLACVAGCATGAAGRGPRWQPFGEGATATDVVAAPAFATDDLRVGLAFPATTRWGSVVGLFNLRGLSVGNADTVVASAGRFTSAPLGHPWLASIPFGEQPAAVTIAIDRARRMRLLNWFDAVAAVGRIDRTPRAPIDLAAALDDARRRWDAHLAAETDALALALEVAGQGTPGVPLGPELVASTDVFYPSWSGDHLTVVHARHVERASQFVVPGHYGCGKYQNLMPSPSPSAADAAPEASPQPSPVPCAPYQAPPTITRRAYSADLALVVEYDASGALISERRFAAHAVPGPAPAPTTGFAP